MAVLEDSWSLSEAVISFMTVVVACCPRNCALILARACLKLGSSLREA